MGIKNLEAVKQLEGVLTEEQLEATIGSLKSIVEEKAQEIAKGIVEEQIGKEKLAVRKAGERYYADKVEAEKGKAKAIVEEMRVEMRSEMVQQIGVIEEQLFGKISGVVEEEIEKATPSDLAEQIAGAKAVMGVVEECREVFAKNMMGLSSDSKKALSIVEEENKKLREEFDSFKNVVEEEKSVLEKDLENTKLESDKNKARAIIEEESFKKGFSENQRKALYSSMQGKNLVEIQNGISIQSGIVEESVGVNAKANIQEEDVKAVGVVEEGVETKTEAKLVDNKKEETLQDSCSEFL